MLLDRLLGQALQRRSRHHQKQHFLLSRFYLQLMSKFCCYKMRVTGVAVVFEGRIVLFFGVIG